jgi:hypothetical protein
MSLLENSDEAPLTIQSNMFRMGNITLCVVSGGSHPSRKKAKK